MIREEKSGGGAAIKRPLENFEYDPDEPLEKMRCIMEQGYLCLGAVTRAGCAGKEGAPRCISARQSCRGCFGPIRKGAKPLVDMMGATVLDRPGCAKSVVDRTGDAQPIRRRARQPAATAGTQEVGAADWRDINLSRGGGSSLWDKSRSTFNPSLGSRGTPASRSSSTMRGMLQMPDST